MNKDSGYESNASPSVSRSVLGDSTNLIIYEESTPVKRDTETLFINSSLSPINNLNGSYLEEMSLKFQPIRIDRELNEPLNSPKKLDFVLKLWKKSMVHVLKKIFSNLSNRDYLRLKEVSKTWLEAQRFDLSHNKERAKAIHLEIQHLISKKVNIKCLIALTKFNNLQLNKIGKL